MTSVPLVETCPLRCLKSCTKFGPLVGIIVKTRIKEPSFLSKLYIGEG